MQIWGSKVELTGCDIVGEVGIAAGDSELDMAGVRVQAAKAAIRADASVRVVFSVSRVDSPHTHDFLHGTRHLARDGAL